MPPTTLNSEEPVKPFELPKRFQSSHKNPTSLEELTLY